MRDSSAELYCHFAPKTPEDLTAWPLLSEPTKATDFGHALDNKAMSRQTSGVWAFDGRRTT